MLIFSFICRKILQFPSIHLKAPGYYLRVILAYALCLALLSLVNGCAGHQKSASPAGALEYKKTGLASFYAKKHQHRKTASGAAFNNNSLTAAHKTLPFGTQVMVKNVDNGKSVKVEINDRGPFIRGRIIDLSRAAFARIANINKGLARVEIVVVE